jgi:hypothetical protein
MTSPKAKVRGSSSSGTRKTSPKAVVQDRDISRTRKTSGGKGAGHPRSSRRRPQNN